MAQNKNLNMPELAKRLGTKVHKSKHGIGEYIRYRFKSFKGIMYYDGSGGVTLKVPGLDCFISHGDAWSQIKDIEEKIAAYKALEPDIKKLKKALAASEYKIPVKPLKHGESNVRKRSKKAS